LFGMEIIMAKEVAAGDGPSRRSNQTRGVNKRTRLSKTSGEVDRSNLEVALLCASNGLPVVALHETVNGRCTCGAEKCEQPGGHPRTPNGLDDATTDSRTIKELWTKWPWAGIGIALGVKAGLFAVVAKGRTGLEQLVALVRRNTKLPQTVVIRDGERRIYLFRAGGANLGKCGGYLAEGARILADGDLIVAPSSLDEWTGKRRFKTGRVPWEIEIAQAPPWLLAAVAPVGDDQEAKTTAEIRRLAELPDIDYEGERDESAKRLKFRKSVLDKLVQQARNEAKAGTSKRGIPSLREPELWPEPVDGAGLLKGLAKAVLRYVVVPKHVAMAIALWVVHTYALAAANISPRLAIKSPLPNCGKSTLLDVLSCLACRPLATSNITAAAVFRTVDSASPTLLIDEGDTFLIKNDELRGILNSGHRRGSAHILRADGEDNEPREFSTWAAAAIATIGPLPETLESRSIRVDLKRKRPDEEIESLDLSRVEDLTELARKVARWVSDQLPELKAADPSVPSTLVNREADNWRPLLAIADAAGGKWPVATRRIAEAVTASARNTEESVKIILLRDIQAAFAKHKVVRLPSATLVRTLTAMEGHPWCEWKGTQPFTQNALARQLKDFNISPVELRIGDKVLRGYNIGQFADAFGRYVVN
jgi:hypothetical protein